MYTMNQAQGEIAKALNAMAECTLVGADSAIMKIKLIDFILANLAH